MVDWFNTGWEAVDKTYEEVGSQQSDSSSNSSSGERKGPFRVRLNGPKFEKVNGEERMVKDGETRRYMLLDNTPASLHEHKFTTLRDDGSKDWNNFEPCKGKQQLPGFEREHKEKNCAVCKNSKSKPYYVGLCTAMSLTPWFSNNGYEWMFNRYILAARLGGPSRPGMLKRIQRLAQQRNNGRLRGMIIECHRGGKKSEVIGDEIDVIDVIPENEILDWARPQIAEFIRRVNVNIRDSENYLTVESVLERDPWVPFDWTNLIRPRSNDELLRLMGKGGYQQNHNSYGGGNHQGGNGSYGGGGGGYVDNDGGGQTYRDPGKHPDDPGPGGQSEFLDDDIPF